MEEVRLMESRKSLRLMDQHFDVDFARLAEGAVVNGAGATIAVLPQQDPHPPRKRSSSGSTTGIDVPGAFVGYTKYLLRNFVPRIERKGSSYFLKCCAARWRRPRPSESG